ncbi:hypothetical protein PILCRDRAFT_827179 [Piloderma croceum F 1598]|uniref:Uncharacterized protein n=1 Tax=Piloderma croceum (strain F 1598) TaxID=765440 RepID=A0A0C3ESC9_PILCF|nr:hypothetical protein PILCRDRAFT_827179 [Piloderma croceum F 1598]
MEPKQILSCPKGKFQRNIQIHLFYTEICVTTQEAVLSMLATSLLDSTTNSVETRVCVSVLVPSRTRPLVELTRSAMKRGC